MNTIPTYVAPRTCTTVDDGEGKPRREQARGAVERLCRRRGVRADRRTGCRQDDGIPDRGGEAGGHVRHGAELSHLRREAGVARNDALSRRPRRVSCGNAGWPDTARRHPQQAGPPGTPPLPLVVPVGRLDGGERQGSVAGRFRGRRRHRHPAGSSVGIGYQGHSDQPVWRGGHQRLCQGGAEAQSGRATEESPEPRPAGQGRLRRSMAGFPQGDVRPGLPDARR